MTRIYTKRNIMSEIKKELPELTELEQRFCQLYLSGSTFGNGVQSFAAVFGFDLEKNPRKYNTCRARASQLLKKPNVIQHLHELKKKTGMTEADILSEVQFVIKQDEDMKAKLLACRLWFELEGRIRTQINMLNVLSTDEMATMLQLQEKVKKSLDP